MVDRTVVNENTEPAQPAGWLANIRAELCRAVNRDLCRSVPGLSDLGVD